MASNGIPSAYFSSRLVAALDYARELHRYQVRKGTTIPYLAHLLGVTALVIAGNSEGEFARGATPRARPWDPAIRRVASI